MRLEFDAGRLVDVELSSQRRASSVPGSVKAKRVAQALGRYFEDPGTSLIFPMTLAGTDFQRRVWRALRQIPAGEVQTYGSLARKLKTSARAIGGACRANPIALFVPCHRVVAATGLGGFMGRRRGAPFAIKRWLLTHEHAR